MTTSITPIRVLLVDDQPLLLEGIATILGAQEGIQVVGRAGSGQQALDLAAELHPDVVCMDVQMPGMNGIDATRRLVAESSYPVRVLVLTTFNQEDYLLAALEAGASGFLLKNAKPDQLADAIRSAAAGDALLAPEVTQAVIRRAVGSERDLAPASGVDGDHPVRLPPQAETLTERELEVLTLVAEGLSNTEIADRLFIGRATVKTHVSNVLLKLELRDRVQAVAFAYRHGIVRGN